MSRFLPEVGDRDRSPESPIKYIQNHGYAQKHNNSIKYTIPSFRKRRHKYMSRDNAVGIATGYGQDDRWV